jgi:hypothetical protein
MKSASCLPLQADRPLISGAANDEAALADKFDLKQYVQMTDEGSEYLKLGEELLQSPGQGGDEAKGKP